MFGDGGQVGEGGGIPERVVFNVSDSTLD